LPETLRDCYDRVLYLDAGMLIKGGDLSALYATDIGFDAVKDARN